jgi:hypothetical protein
MSRRSEEQQVYRDRLLQAGETLQALQVFGSMAQRDEQNERAKQQLGLEQEALKLREREEWREWDQKRQRVEMSSALSDFLGNFDPTNVRHQKELAMWETAARTKGFDDREVENMVLPAKKGVIVLNDQLAAMRRESGIQDWEKMVDPTTNEERIDVAGTMRKHDGMMKDLAQVVANWEPGGREDQLLDQLSLQGLPKSQAVRVVNRNQRTGSEYSALIEEGLFAPSAEFLGQFRKPLSKPGVTLAEESMAFVPTMYNADLFDTHPGAVKARAALRRMQKGEVPVFKKDNGAIAYDPSGAAIIESWQPSLDDRKKSAEVMKAESEAAEEIEMNAPTRQLDPITGLPTGPAGPSLRQQVTQADLELKKARTEAARYQMNGGQPVTVLPTEGD